VNEKPALLKLGEMLAPSGGGWGAGKKENLKVCPGGRRLDRMLNLLLIFWRVEG